MRDSVLGAGRIAVLIAGLPTYEHTDGLASVTDLTNGSGASLAWSEYAPYGAVRTAGAAAGAPADPFEFTGQYQDAATSLYYLRARTYDPTTGRFLTVDPMTSRITDVPAATYAYARDNPIAFVDPTGLWTAAACVSFNLGVGVVQVALQACVAQSSAGQGGVTLTWGGGGGANLDISAGAGIQVSNGNTLSDLGGPFGSVGGSAEAGVGLSGDVFGGAGRCPGTIVNGMNLGVTVGGGWSASANVTRTHPFQVTGPQDQSCSVGQVQK